MNDTPRYRSRARIAAGGRRMSGAEWAHESIEGSAPLRLNLLVQIESSATASILRKTSSARDWLAASGGR